MRLRQITDSNYWCDRKTENSWLCWQDRVRLKITDFCHLINWSIARSLIRELRRTQDVILASLIIFIIWCTYYPLSFIIHRSFISTVRQYPLQPHFCVMCCNLPVSLIIWSTSPAINPTQNSSHICKRILLNQHLSNQELPYRPFTDFRDILNPEFLFAVPDKFR